MFTYRESVVHLTDPSLLIFSTIRDVLRLYWLWEYTARPSVHVAMD